MDQQHADRLAKFASLADLEPVEATLTPAAAYYGGAFTAAAPSPRYRGGAAVVADMALACRNGVGGIDVSDAQRPYFYSGLRQVHERRRTRATQRVRTGSPAARAPRSQRRESHRGRPGHRRVRSSSRAGPSSDSDSDGPGDAGPPAPRRRVVVDSHYVVIGMVTA